MNLRQAAQQALKEMDDHMYRADTHEFYEAKEALRAALAEPEQEPVAWRLYKDGELYALKFEAEDRGPHYRWEPLYTAPTPRKPLTNAEIWNTYKNLWMFHPAEEPRLAGDVLKFARAIERAHGIGEQT